MKTKDLALYGVLIALYLVITTLNPISYGPIQFRVSEVILLLPFFNKKFILPCIVAVGLANVFSPLGPIDVFTGVLIAVVTYYGVQKVISEPWVLAVLYSFICGFLVSAELVIMFSVPYFVTFLGIVASQLLITITGVFAIEQLDKILHISER